MKVVIGLVFMGILSAFVAAQPVGNAIPASPAEADAATLLSGRTAFEREVLTANEQYDRAKLRYEESTERARLNYIKVLEDNLGDRGNEDSHAAEYQKELTRVRGLKFHAPKFEYTMYRWEHNAPPVKMIHKDEGFCYLADVGGAFHGGGEVARVYIGEDGYWYLHGSTAHGFLVVGAMAVKTIR